jgi:hypothetical protein
VPLAELELERAIRCLLARGVFGEGIEIVGASSKLKVAEGAGALRPKEMTEKAKDDLTAKKREGTRQGR